MFDPERFKRQLAETIAWCTPRVDVDDLRNSLRNVLPQNIHDLSDYELIMRVVEPAITIRSTLLEAANRIDTANKKPVQSLPVGLANGRLLAFYPGYAIYDPAAEVESHGYFNFITIPAWDTWVYSGPEVIPALNANKPLGYIICWIPPQIIELVDSATECDPTECIQWLNKTKISLPFLDILRNEGLLD